MSGKIEQTLSKYAWVDKKNYLPNFYLRPTRTESYSTDDVYSNATIVFVHNQKSGGTTTKYCWKSILRDEGRDLPILAANTNAEEFYTEMLYNRSNHRLARSYMGDSTFGICDFTEAPCSYFTILRDPYERVISSYNMCKTSTQQQCIVKNASTLSVNEWAVHQGSFFFRQLLTNPAFFTPFYIQLVDKLRGPNDPDTSMIPPWWKTELILRHLLTNDEREVLLQYVLDRMEYWFAVIGLTDEYDNNLRMLEEVYKLPFHSKCSDIHKMNNQYDRGTLDANIDKDEIVKMLRNDLLSDPDVSRSLYYDNEIYRRARDIFRRQKLAYEERQMHRKEK
ncbi:uncharacterized protein LOC144350692 [Saccoglossus kowalevskii]